MAGPDWSAATVPVSTKTLVPIVAPMPIHISDQAPKVCLRRSAPASSRGLYRAYGESLRNREGWRLPGAAIGRVVHSGIVARKKALDPGIAPRSPCSAQARSVSMATCGGGTYFSLVCGIHVPAMCALGRGLRGDRIPEEFT